MRQGNAMNNTAKWTESMGSGHHGVCVLSRAKGGHRNAAARAFRRSTVGRTALVQPMKRGIATRSFVPWTDTSATGPTGARALSRVEGAANGVIARARRLCTEGGPARELPTRRRRAIHFLVQSMACGRTGPTGRLAMSRVEAEVVSAGAHVWIPSTAVSRASAHPLSTQHVQTTRVPFLESGCHGHPGARAH